MGQLEAFACSPQLTIGEFVAQGQQIGRTSNSEIEDGTAADMHVHYTQRRDGEAVRIMFKGTLIDTHAGNEDSWGSIAFPPVA